MLSDALNRGTLSDLVVDQLNDLIEGIFFFFSSKHGTLSLSMASP